MESLRLGAPRELAIITAALWLLISPAGAQTAEESAALLWLGLEDGAVLNRETAVRRGASPAVFDSIDTVTKAVSIRITVKQANACLYNYRFEPQKPIPDRFGERMKPFEFEVDFSHVTGIQTYDNEPDQFFYIADRQICRDIANSTLCSSGARNGPPFAPPAPKAREALARFQRDTCKHSN